MLAHGGIFHLIGPAIDHLQALKQIIYDRVEPHAGNFDSVVASDAWQEIGALTVRQATRLVPPAITDLFCMTPYYWSATKAQQQAIESHAALSVTFAFDIRSFRFIGSGPPLIVNACGLAG